MERACKALNIAIIVQKVWKPLRSVESVLRAQKNEG